MLDSSVSNSLSPEAMEKTFLMVKVSGDPGSLADPISQPDGVQRGLVGEILRRLEKKGLQLQACKLLQVRPAVQWGRRKELLARPPRSSWPCTTPPWLARGRCPPCWNTWPVDPSWPPSGQVPAILMAPKPGISQGLEQCQFASSCLAPVTPAPDRLVPSWETWPYR